MNFKLRKLPLNCCTILRKELFQINVYKTTFSNFGYKTVNANFEVMNELQFEIGNSIHLTDTIFANMNFKYPQVHFAITVKFLIMLDACASFVRDFLTCCLYD